MPTVKLNQTIGRKPEDVFRVYADVEHHPKWNPIVVEAKKVSGADGAGAKFRMLAKGFGKMDLEIVEYDPGKRLKILGQTGMAEMTHLFEMRADGDKTVVDHTVVGKPKGLAILMTPFMGGMMRRNLAKGTGAAQKHLESGG